MSAPTTFRGIRGLHKGRYTQPATPITEVAPHQTDVAVTASSSTQLTESRRSTPAASVPKSFAGIRSLHRSR